jgi:hypothetical protein
VGSIVKGGEEHGEGGSMNQVLVQKCNMRCHMKDGSLVHSLPSGLSHQLLFPGGCYLY